MDCLLGVPPPPVQLGDHPGGQVHHVGQELTALAAHRIGVADVAQQVALAGADPAVGDPPWSRAAVASTGLSSIQSWTLFSFTRLMKKRAHSRRQRMSIVELLRVVNEVPASPMDW